MINDNGKDFKEWKEKKKISKEEEENDGRNNIAWQKRKV